MYDPNDPRVDMVFWCVVGMALIVLIAVVKQKLGF
jgi:hypothetical protein